MSVRGSPWPMKPPTAMLIPLSTWDIASSMGTTLFLGTFHSFARERRRASRGVSRPCAAPPAGHARCGRVSLTAALPRAPLAVSAASRAATLPSAIGRRVRIADGAIMCAPARILYTSRGASVRREGTVCRYQGFCQGRRHRRIGLLRAARERPRGRHRHAVRRPQRLLLPRRDRRRAGGLPAASRARAPHPARRGQLPRQHLGHEGAGRALRALRQRRRQPARGAQAARRRRARPALRPHQGAARAPSSATASSCTWASPIRSAPTSASSSSSTAAPSAPPCTRAAPTSASRVRSSRTRAECNVYRQLGFDIIGMTNLQEAKLAREAELCYATMAHGHRLRRVVRRRRGRHARAGARATCGATSRRRRRSCAASSRLSTSHRDCACRHAVEFAINTPAELIPQAHQRQARPADRQVPALTRRGRSQGGARKTTRSRAPGTPAMSGWPRRA